MRKISWESLYLVFLRIINNNNCCLLFIDYPIPENCCKMRRRKMEMTSLYFKIIRNYWKKVKKFFVIVRCIVEFEWYGVAFYDNICNQRRLDRYVVINFAPSQWMLQEARYSGQHRDQSFEAWHGVYCVGFSTTNRSYHIRHRTTQPVKCDPQRCYLICRRKWDDGVIRWDNSLNVLKKSVHGYLFKTETTSHDTKVYDWLDLMK